jgi:O-antigen/teichoic acid export membrane protein
MAAVSLTAILLTQIDKIILSKILSLEQFGYYTIACSLGMMITQVLGPITQSYFPKLANLISLNKQQELKNVYHQACQLKSVLVIPATVMLVVFSKELIFIWTKNPVTVENTWLVTALYAFGVGMNGLMHIPYLLTVANGWTRFGVYINLCMLILMIPLTIFLAFQYGTIGGALSWAILNTLYFFFSPILIHKKYLKGEAFNWYWKDTLLPIIGTIAIILLAKLFLLNKIYNNTTELILLITVGIIAVLASTSLASQLRPALATILKKRKF